MSSFAGTYSKTAKDLKGQPINKVVLPKAAETEGFEIWVNGDQNIPYEQNLYGREISLVVLGSNR